MLRDATIVYLGRTHAMGERRRVDDWERILRASGLRVEQLPLLPEHRRSAHRVIADLPSVIGRAALAPEALIWDPRTVRQRLDRVHSDVVVFVSARAFHPSLADGSWIAVLDLVDRLSVSYRDRARIDRRLTRRLGFRFLAAAAARVERHDRPGTMLVAAGWEDARALSARWVPNVVSASPPGSPTRQDVDVVFVGTLRYPPNIEAVERLAHLWPRVLHARPGTTALIAGASPSPRVLAAVSERGWTIEADFEDVQSVMGRARVAVAPLMHASGIQNKVIDAAAAGLAQVVDLAALRGLDPNFPVPTARDDDELVSLLVGLLNDDARREDASNAAQDHVLKHYSVERWAAELLDLLEGQQAQRPPP